MCGFAGILGFDPVAGENVRRMGSAIRHRGPDSAGAWGDADNNIYLSHQRLSIQDLSSAGHQPMLSASGRYVVAFNGEIYNHLELRSFMKGALWRGHSDTETMLAGFDFWGIKETISRLVGMFAISIWDREEKKLTLVRDRFGEKPLYYGWHGNGSESCFLFGSELKALIQHPSFRSTINRNALSLYLRHSYVPSPHCIYENTFKVDPASIVTVSLKNQEPVVESYWSLPDVATSQSASSEYSEQDHLNNLEEKLIQSVSQQMISDVPIGAFLSGGLDSSLIAATMQTLSGSPINTFTIGFNEKQFNEAEFAKAVSKHLGTNHTEMYVGPQDALDIIPKLPEIYDEPFSDSSQVPTSLVCNLASQHVTVALSGDAGDELFCGYNRYMLTENTWKRLALLPAKLRAIIARGILSISPNHLDSIIGTISKVKPNFMNHMNIGDKLHKAAGIMGANSMDELYLGLVSHWTKPAELTFGAHELPTKLTSLKPHLEGLNSIEKMMVLDAISYLPDDILVKVDRAAMHVSLETRVPFLDHRLAEYAWQMPYSTKLKGNETKWALRQLLYRHVPEKLFDRPKTGFGVPLADWLRGPLKDWAYALIDSLKEDQEKYLDYEIVNKKWQEHLSGKRNWSYWLWDILMFQAWLEHNKKAANSTDNSNLEYSHVASKNSI